jgi:hypothetical protein
MIENTLMILKCINYAVWSLSYEVESLQRVATYWEEKKCHGLPPGIELELAKMKVLGLQRQG